ncbi:hypothetical protein [Candidatus Doolittlea endobia]|uniref:hypothetical protein n=1 Tax=Candidatus Doolittlea endobia TaxID=1778262 RepID=UPI001E2BDF62|nr:hypothetical protein [Candidatus Doolittlea endobia]
MRKWDQRYQDRSEVLFRTIRTAVYSHLSDTQSFDFKGLTQDNVMVAEILVFTVNSFILR